VDHFSLLRETVSTDDINRNICEVVTVDGTAVKIFGLKIATRCDNNDENCWVLFLDTFYKHTHRHRETLTSHKFFWCKSLRSCCRDDRRAGHKYVSTADPRLSNQQKYTNCKPDTGLYLLCITGGVKRKNMKKIRDQNFTR